MPDESEVPEVPTNNDDRPKPNEVFGYEACGVAARSMNTVYRAVKDGRVRARRWMGMLLINRDDLEDVFAPGTLQRREAMTARNTQPPGISTRSTPASPGYGS